MSLPRAADPSVRRERADTGPLRGYLISDSSAVDYVGWVEGNVMLVRYRGDAVYLYVGVNRQRAVACAHARSVGRYIAANIRDHYSYARVCEARP